MVRGTFVSSAESERTTLNEALLRYSNEITIKKKGALAEKNRVKQFQRHPLANRTLASIRSSDIAAYHDARMQTVSAQSTLHEINLLSNLFNIARKEWGMKNLVNPVSIIKKTKLPQGRGRRLTKEEECHLLSAAGESAPLLRPLVTTALGTAMRLGELLSLTWKNVDFVNQAAPLNDTKNGTARTVPLSSGVITVLKQLPQLDGDLRIFSTWKAADSIHATWKRVIKRAQAQYELECRS